MKKRKTQASAAQERGARALNRRPLAPLPAQWYFRVWFVSRGSSPLRCTDRNSRRRYHRGSSCTRNRVPPSNQSQSSKNRARKSTCQSQPPEIADCSYLDKFAYTGHRIRRPRMSKIVRLPGSPAGPLPLLS